jgi:ABC-type multidrug transport system fused ATPase/permease subunit
MSGGRKRDRRHGPTIHRQGGMERRGGRPRKPQSVERRLFGLLKPYWRATAAGVLVSLAMTVVGLATPWPMKILIDDVFGPHQIFGLSKDGALALSVGLTLVVFMLSGALGLLQTQILIGLSQRLVANLRREVFSHVTRLSLRFHDERAAADSVYRLTNDTYAVQSVLLDAVVPLSSSILTLGGTMAIMIALDPQLAFLSLVSLPLAAFVTYRFTGRVREQSMALRDQEAEVYAHAEQTLGGIRTVQAFGREGYELERFSRRVGASRQAMMKLTRTQVLFGLAVDFVLAAGLALVTYVAARHALRGSLTPGEVLVFLAYAGGLYGPVSGLASLVRELQQSAVAAQRVFEVLDEQWLDRGYEHAAPTGTADGYLALREVDFSYSDGSEVLHGVDFAVRPGEMVALVGPTGAGKSTIASLLLRLYDPTSGRVELDGVDLRRLPLEWVRDQIAFVPQEPALFHASVRENIRYGRLDATDAEVDQAAREAGVLDELVQEGRDLDSPLGDGGVTLSGGQRQRVAIARAMLKDSPIVLMDEPTSALDAVTERALMDSFAHLFEGRTVVVIAHRLATVERADRIFVVRDGRIVQQGSHSSLVHRHGLYAELHAARFGQTGDAATQPRVRPMVFLDDPPEGLSLDTDAPAHEMEPA